MTALLLVLALLLTEPAVALADEFEGHVIGILDGDTVEILRGREVLRIRLQGVDSPEMGQPFGTDAQAFIMSLALGKRARITTEKPLKPGFPQRGQVSLVSGVNLSHELLKAGLAWWDRRVAPEDDSLWKLEREARTEHRGLWEDPDPIPPWEWRKGF